MERMHHLTLSGWYRKTVFFSVSNYIYHSYVEDEVRRNKVCNDCCALPRTTKMNECTKVQNSWRYACANL